MFQAVIAALLHDVMEDTAVTKAEIAVRFGKQVADLVDGAQSKLERIEFPVLSGCPGRKFPQDVDGNGA